MKFGTIPAERFIVAWNHSTSPEQRLHPADFPLGADVRITPIKSKHTDEQRGYYWLSIEWWLMKTGYSAAEAQAMKDRVHYEVICCETFGVEKIINFRGVAKRIPKQSSSKLNREDYTKLIDTMLRLAAEDGVVIPEPIE